MIAIIIIALGITIKVTKNIECFTTEEIESKLNIPSDKVKKDHEKNKSIHNKNKNVLVGDIIFMSKEHKTEEGKKYKPTFTENGCEYLLIKDNQKFNFSGSKYKDFVEKFLDGQEGEYIIHVGSGAIGSGSKQSFELGTGNKNNTITFKKIGEDKVVEFKDAIITSDEIFKSTAIAPYFFTRSQNSNIETPWLEKPMEIKANLDVDIKSVLPNGKVYLYVCISTISD
ncbi:MAG: hypothetical protein IKA36_06745 [Clostridia bacterium]|nr:hypothetical protein [Clostridia bacterium]